MWLSPCRYTSNQLQSSYRRLEAAPTLPPAIPDWRGMDSMLTGIGNAGTSKRPRGRIRTAWTQRVSAAQPLSAKFVVEADWKPASK